MRVESRQTRLWAFAVSVVVVAAGLVATTTPAQALSGAEFDPGYIISDAAFYDANAMSQPEIQSFLERMAPGACGPFSCLKNYRMTTSDRAQYYSNSSGQVECQFYKGAANELASTIIFRVQQACGISAKVILVTLQKERSLVTKTSPEPSDFRAAMGYACPDSSACDTIYYGLFNQIRSASEQFKRYKVAPGDFGYRAGRVNHIQQKPGCSTLAVNIRNQATAGLYNYTPYVPNAAALANLFGLGDGCSSYGNRNFWVFYNNWFGSPVGQINPIGDVNSVSPVVGGVAIWGWVFDPDTIAPIQTHVYVDGTYLTTMAADQSRPDVEVAYPGRGVNHGFSGVLPVVAGNHSVCIYGINEGPGTNVLLGCRSVTVSDGSNPQGGVNEMNVTPSLDGLFIRGFVFDADTTSPVLADVWVNGGYRTTLVADKARPDVQAAFPGQGPNHGFAAEIALSPGISTICIYGINVGGGSVNTLLGCRTVTVTPNGSNPVGDINGVINTGPEVAVWGWAFDADTLESILVDVWVNGAYRATLVADQNRPDVAQTYPGRGSAHGFGTMVTLNPGINDICFFGINVGGGNHTQLGCRTVAKVVNVPKGDINALVGVPNGVSTYGWVFDEDTADPILADVWIDGSYAATLVADAPRADVAAVYPRMGPNHGFGAVIPTAPGNRTVCIYGIDVGGNSHILLGCKSITVPS